MAGFVFYPWQLLHSNSFHPNCSISIPITEAFTTIRVWCCFQLGFLHNCFALVNPSRCSRNLGFAQASELCTGFKPQQCPLLYSMGTQDWVYVPQQKETNGFTSADKTEGLAWWRSKEPSQANAGLKPSSTNICSSEVAPGDSRHTTTVNI